MALSENWATLWEAIADAQPDHAAVVIGERRMRWRDLDERAARLAGGLADCGVAADGTGKVAQLLYNCPEYLESLYAALKLRAAPVNVNYRYRGHEIAHVLADSGAEVLVFQGSLAEHAAEAARLVPTVRVLVQVDDGSPLLDAAVPYEQLLAHDPLPRMARRGDDALLLYTGGTTGLPKGVVWRHVDLFGAMAFTGYLSAGINVPETAAEVGAVAARLNAEGKSPVNLCAPPLMHGTALFLSMSTFVLGGTVVLLGGRRFDPDELLRLAEQEHATQISLVGDAFAVPIVQALERAEAAGRPYDLSSLQRVVSTGATLSAECKRGLMSRAPAVTVIDMIGASEGGPFAVAMTPPGSDPGETAVFKAPPGVVLFDDQTWEPIPPGSGRIGVLGVGGAIPSGYYSDPERTARTFRVIDGQRFSIPGDYAIIDEDRTVHLLGRGSVCINTGGEKVYPEEVEVVARSHPAVADCVAVGVPDPRLGEVVTLVAAAAPGAVLVPDELIAHVRATLATYKAPRHVVVVDSVYRSPSGKADYKWARETAMRELGAGVHP